MANGITAANGNTKVQNINNVSVINIATPNNSGISHNKYTQFNVTEKGAVLNNATAAGKSQLVGQINANTNLKGKGAALIINKVTSNARAELKGKTEVFGRKTDVIVANPNGISCDGCGFIHTKGVTLTTGIPIFDKNGAMDALTVKKGTVIIGEKGFDATGQNYADIISRATEINGKIKAKSLTLLQGANRLDYKKGSITPIAGEGAKPNVAIDTKNLGGMYANCIRLVSNEYGVGVNINNLTSTVSDITLNAKRKIQLGHTNAKTDINIGARELEIGSGINLRSGKDIMLAADIVNNRGSIVAAKDLRVFANQVTNTRGSLQAGNNMWIQKDINGKRSALLKNISGTIKTNSGDLIIRSDKVENKRATSIVDISKVEPNSTYFHSILTISQAIEEWDDGDELYLAKIKDFSAKKGFGEIDFKISDYINSARNLVSYNNSSPDRSYISNPNYWLYRLYEKLNLWQTKEEYITFFKVGEEKTFKTMSEIVSPIIAGGNLVADFKDTIFITTPNMSGYKEITDITNRPATLSANDIVLNANNIENNGVINAKGTVSLIANNSVKTTNGNIYAAKDINIAAVNHINLNQAQLNANNITLLSRSGNVHAVTPSQTRYLDTQQDQQFGQLNTRGILDIIAGQQILLSDQQINVAKGMSLIAVQPSHIKGSVELSNAKIYDTTRTLEK